MSRSRRKPGAAARLGAGTRALSPRMDALGLRRDRAGQRHTGDFLLRTHGGEDRTAGAGVADDVADEKGRQRQNLEA